MNEGWTVPDGYTADNVAHCRSCKAEILWAITPRGAKAPLDRDGTNHFITCPDRDRWRKKKEAK
jgi:hypothetical protein